MQKEKSDKINLSMEDPSNVTPQSADWERQVQELVRRRQVAESLRGILGILNSNLPLPSILSYITQQAARLLDADAVAIYRLDGDGLLRIQSSLGLDDEYARHAAISLREAATGQAVYLRQAVNIPDINHAIDQNIGEFTPTLTRLLAKLTRNYHAILAVPLIIREDVYGAISLYYTTVRAATQDEIDLAVSFADQAALAIENARLRAQIEQTAVTAERNRIARELHDSVTQTLFSANLIADVLPQVWGRSTEEGLKGLAELRQLTRGALAEMRTLLLELRPAALSQARLEDLLRQLSEATAGRMRARVELNLDQPFPVPQDVRIAFYRIAQEALNNIARHADAGLVQIDLRGLPKSAPRRLELSIRDDGCGFNPATVPSDHLGISIMRERAQSIGAHIEITSRPRCGTIIRVDWTKERI